MFEIKHENQNGIFHVKLNRNLTSDEVVDIAQVAITIVGQVSNTPMIDAIGNIIPNGGQTKLGEKPVDKIKLGTYVEPDTGVRIRMLHFPQENRVEAIKAFREITGISLVACRDIVYGNFTPPPILTREMADAIIKKFRELDVYASVVDGQCKREVEG